jgi:hypothetical protein
LGLGFGFWQDVHKYAGIVILVGVTLHLVLHFNWILSMTKKMLSPAKNRKTAEVVSQEQE